MVEALVSEILKLNGLPANDVTRIKEGDDEFLYSVNGEYVLRLTPRDVRDQFAKLTRVAGLDPALKVRACEQSLLGTKYNYILYTKIRGVDFFDCAGDMPIERMRELGKDVAGFMRRLHAVGGSTYDIGHYVPILPGFAGSWKAGHLEYWDYIRIKLDALGLSDRPLIREAFAFLESTRDSLDYQAGPALLHNDLHPKNIIVDEGRFSGVIDWECSQFGEPDFELCHFIHWCLYPPSAGADLVPFVKAILEERPFRHDDGTFARRQGAYQVEHELMQVVWSGGGCLQAREPRLEAWIDGAAERFIASFI